MADEQIPSEREPAPYLNCPRCGLSLELKARWLKITHCPRCIARSRTIVELFGSPLPAELLYASGCRPPVQAAAGSSRRRDRGDGQIALTVNDLAGRGSKAHRNA